MAEEQKNIVFKNIPEFIRAEWKLVLGPSSKGGIEATKGSVFLGNGIVMFSQKENAKVISDYSSLEINSVVQYNLVSNDSDTGYYTFFHLISKKGDVIVYPHVDFWYVCIRFGKAGPYAVYSAIQANRIESLKRSGFYDKYLESERSLLQKSYSNLSRGLE